MKDKNKISLVSSEIASLWQSYMSDSMSRCIFKYFLNTAEDPDVKPHLQQALDLSADHLENITEIFNNEGLPIPQGFDDNDVNLNAPPLYTDSFMLLYLRVMCNSAVTAYSTAYNNAARADIRSYFSQCLKTTLDANDKVANTLLNNGIFVKAPEVEVPKEVSFIKKRSFFTGLFVEPRQITTVELLHIFNCILTNTVAKILLLGFGQSALSKEVRTHMLDKADSLEQHIQFFNKVLSNDQVQIPASSEKGVTSSTTPPFSDKLMMFHDTTLLGHVLISNYGAAIGSCFRSDLIAKYISFITEIGKHSTNGANIMIENKWLEQPPQIVNHRELAKV